MRELLLLKELSKGRKGVVAQHTVLGLLQGSNKVLIANRVHGIFPFRHVFLRKAQELKQLVILGLEIIDGLFL